MRREKVIPEYEPDGYVPELTPLWAALRHDDERLVCELLRAGTDPHEVVGYDDRSGTGGVALGYAVAWDLLEAIRCFLAAGADPNSLAHNRAPMVAFSMSRRAVELLVAAGSDVNYADPDNGGVPLERVALLGAREAVEAMIAAGADVNVRDASDATPMFNVGSVANAEALVAAGADPTATTRHGEQPLLMAAIRNDVDLVRFFLLAGCDPDLPNVHGETPGDASRRHRALAAAEMIERWPRP